jgi:branched-chain amino acid transport system ATP-binding protein
VTLLALRDVVAGYGSGEVLHGIGLEVDDGGVTALLGANGAGKTTTLRAVSGMIGRRGSIRFAGRDLVALSTDRIARLGIAHVPQGRGTLARLSVRDNLYVGALRRRDRAAVAADLRRVEELFPVLGERAGSDAGTLSGGEQQMLALGRALMSEPQLICMDEPSLGLAPLVVQDIFRTIAAINAAGTSVLLVEQNARYALETASRGYVLQTGKIVASGPCAALRNDENLRQAYLGRSAPAARL